MSCTNIRKGLCQCCSKPSRTGRQRGVSGRCRFGGDSALNSIKFTKVELGPSLRHSSLRRWDLASHTAPVGIDTPAARVEEKSVKGGFVGGLLPDKDADAVPQVANSEQPTHLSNL